MSAGISTFKHLLNDYKFYGGGWFLFASYHNTSKPIAWQLNYPMSDEILGIVKEEIISDLTFVDVILLPEIRGCQLLVFTHAIGHARFIAEELGISKS